MTLNPQAPGGALKKTLAVVVLASLMLTGCSSKQEATEPASAATAVATTAAAKVGVPGVVGLTLDKATEQLEDLGFEVEAKDTVDGKSIVKKSNWQVISQDPAENTQAEEGSTVKLGVKSLELIEAEKVAAEKAAAEKAAAEAAAAAQAAADQAARDAAARKAVPAPAAPAAPAPAPAPAGPAAPAAPAPAAAYYANCTAARAAGAAPVYAGSPGYGKHLDRDGDGIGCDK